MAKDKKNLDLENFDFEKFKKNALSDLKSGGSISGKDSVFKPLRACLKSYIIVSYNISSQLENI